MNYKPSYLITTVASAASLVNLLASFTTTTSFHLFATTRQHNIRRMSSDSSSNSATLNRKPVPGEIVNVSYILEPNDDFVPIPIFDVGNDVTFVLDGGNYLPGLHSIVSTLHPGEKIEGISIDAGWGERRDDLIAKVPKDAQEGLDDNAIKIGTELFLANGMKCKVIDVNERDFTIDANPPLAGASYTAKVTLNSVAAGPSEAKYQYTPDGTTIEDESKYEVMTIALGCFWGGELEYMRVPGVVGTAVGYTQGRVDNPTYEQVCSGTTGHTEGIQVIFDPSIVSYEELARTGLERLGESKFLLNQVGNDRGTQYRHGLYYHNDDQKKMAEKVIETYGKSCVTECKPAMKFYTAEDYHQQYLLKGGQSARKNADEAIRCYG